MPLREANIAISKLFLDLQNPRFEPVKDEAAAISHLAKDEKVSTLAEDIVQQNGLNPLEIIGVTPASGTKGKSGPYIVVEGNRRICAIKLLNDPDLAPPEHRNRFKKLASMWKGTTSMEVVVFASREEAKPWLERLHEGEKDGVGRKAWDATQKQRFTGSSKNAQAMSLLELAEKEGWAAKGETKGLLTTIQRYLNNPILRNELGLEGTDREVLRRSRPRDEFNALAKQFVRDAIESKSAKMADRKVNSRAGGTQIAAYANKLAQRVKTSGERIEPEVVTSNGANHKPKKTRKTKPKAPEVPTRLLFDSEAYGDLKKIGNQKLIHLYYSVCSLELAEHAVLVSVGIWSFFECMTAATGRTETTSMTGFLSRDFLQRECGITKEDSKAVWAALDSIARRGNDSKHHAFAGSYDPQEINNNWVVTAGVVKALVQRLEKKK
jgi:hypothetical protein